MNCVLILKQIFVIVVLTCLITESCAAIYSDTWAVHVDGDEDIARSLAEKHGFTYVGPIMDGYHELRHHRVSKRSLSASSHVHETLHREPQVKWLEQQVVKRRVKRNTNLAEQEASSSRQKRHVDFNDPKWPRMWYLSRTQGTDMNVLPAWEMGFTGKDVVVTILDDGIERDHPDLTDNYDPGASYDVNGRDPDPQPRYDYSNENRHGTRCAGEVAAKANNQLCGLGVAYDASIGGVRMLDGDVTDAVEASSLSLYPQHIDIYSASWGPDDDGRTVDGPGIMAKKAFFDGINKGRGGKGSIFVWASGNGGRDKDNCNCDGYTNSIYTLSISSATENLQIPWYSEACSSTLATTYSSGSGGEREIVTTDLRKSCTERHTGTSASAPLAAGVCALALQANPHLTWRDLQHIVVKTARPEGLISKDWVRNGVGRKVSHSFGYGLMDAAAMVKEALNWTTVPKQHMCTLQYQGGSKNIPTATGARQVSLTINSRGCKGTPHEVVYLEHVQAIIKMTAVRRGDISITLTSPAGTVSTLLAKRVKDRSTEGFDNWSFMTTHSWGEHSVGVWTLTVQVGDTRAEVLNWSLVLYGTSADPYLGHPGHNPDDHPDYPGELPQPECNKEEYVLDNYCYKECPQQYFAANKTLTSETDTNVSLPVNSSTIAVCESCSQICLKCFGPSADECLECTDNFKLTTDHRCVTSNETFFGKHRDLVFLVLSLLFCFCAILLFAVIFCFLQAIENGYCCFKKPMINLDGGKNLPAQELKKPQNNHNHNKTSHNGRLDLAGQHDALLGGYDSEDGDLGDFQEAELP